MNPPEPQTYPAGEPLPECGTCHERSISDLTGRCLNPDCPSHSACEGCGEGEAPITLLGATPLRLCLRCGEPAIRAILAGVAP